MTAEPQSIGLIENENWSTSINTEAESPPEKTFCCKTLEEQNCPHHEDMDMHSSGSNGIYSSGNDSNGHESSGTDSHVNEPSRRSNCAFRRPSKSTGSSNSEQMDRTRSHKELMSMVKEMKRSLPSEKMNRNKPSTVDALNYALKCVRQVQANSAFFQVLGDSGTSRIDSTVYTVEELEAITSEHPPKNTDTFVIVFSLTSGKMVHISDQASYILNYKKKVLDSSRFVELLAPQDVGVFYKHTTQSHLLPWNTGADTASLYEYTQVKSFFCRIRRDKDRDHEIRYNPYRMTPYSVRVHSSAGVEAEPCCLAFVEKIHSGYEAPRIPLDKRIFTTTHTPGCVFLEVDDRAVPLLGYLPQELVGTSVLTYLHPEDRPLMLAMHRKILKYAGQPPFEHSPIRFCTQNGDYITLDTSWSSFVNPWSRKVAFIIGRHKVRTGPLNKDVFAAPSREIINVDKEMKELQGQIYKVLLQPVHNNGSSGYGSLGSNGSYEHYISIASSSDSNGNCVDETHKEPMTIKQVCSDINCIKNLGQQVYIDTRSKPLTKKWETLDKERQKAKENADTCLRPYQENAAVEGPAASSSDASGKGQQIPSYQQINCVDSIIRYLENYNIPALKRKCESSSNTSSSEGDKQVSHGQNDFEILEEVIAIEDATGGCEQIEMISLHAQVATVAPAEEFKQVGLTKEVLSAHTQKEEQNYVDRFQQRILQSPYSSYLQQDSRSKGCSHEQDEPFSRQTTPAVWKKGKKHGKHKRQKPMESSDSNGSHPNFPSWLRRQGPLPQAFPPSEVSQPSPSHMAFPPPMMIPIQPTYSMPGFQLPHMTAVGGDCTASSECAQQSNMPCNMQPFPAFPSPYMGTLMAVVLPNYNMYTQINTQIPQPLFPSQYPCSSSYPFTGMPRAPQSMPSQIPTDFMDPTSRASSPMSEEGQKVLSKDPPLFSNSRSSSPLQLVLLQEELPKLVEPSEGIKAEKQVEIKSAEDSGNNDSHSTSSELFDLLLQEDSQSGTGSAASGSGSAESSSFGFGSNGSTSYGTSGSGIGSSNSSKYFASNDSSDTSKKGHKQQEVVERDAFPKAVGDSIWTMIERTPTPIMMTYQVPERDKEILLKEDLEKLTAMRHKQPWFTEEQKEELAEVHSWIRNRTFSQEIDTRGCVTCMKSAAAAEKITVTKDRCQEEGVTAATEQQQCLSCHLKAKDPTNSES
ncbi:period circadian protein homolog 3 isoform X2 [Ascaphus truei]|uniref:period circadian protein homolog 3 isoform X2 n=1 Tax=Ascaphus truei TaxID=8439 RepID=UPI003F59EE98